MRTLTALVICSSLLLSACGDAATNVAVGEDAPIFVPPDAGPETRLDDVRISNDLASDFTVRIETADESSPAEDVPVSDLELEDSQPADVDIAEAVDPPEALECSADQDCDDSNQCTLNLCLESGSCEHSTLQDQPCDDGDVCTSGDLCDAQGTCVAGEAIECTDEVDCTIDSCDPEAGCVSTPDDAGCEEGIACTVDVCDPVVGCLSTPDVGLCDDGNPDTDDSCDLDLGCLHIFPLPDPVTTEVGDDTEELILEWPSGVSVKVKVSPVSFDPGTDVGVKPIGANNVYAPIPGLLIDSLAFNFDPGGLLKHPVPITVEYKSEECGEVYALVLWSSLDKRYEPAPFLDKNVEDNTLIFSLSEGGDYYLVCPFAEALQVERLSSTEWTAAVELQDWPGLKQAQVEVKAGFDAGSIKPDDAAGLWVGPLGSAKDVQFQMPAQGSPGRRLIEIELVILQEDEDSPTDETEYGYLLWEVAEITDGESPAGTSELLLKYAPIFQFAEGEQAFPTAIQPFLEVVDEVVLPSGRVHAVSGAGEAKDKFSHLGHEKALLFYDSGAIPQPINAGEGTVYGRAFDNGFGQVALVYALYFSQSEVLGPEADIWGTQRGDVKYVVVTLGGLGDQEPESLTLSQHLPGSGVEYLGDEEMPIWTKGDFEGGRLKLAWEDTLRCKRSGGDYEDEEHPWVFVGKNSHAFYPRKGEYKVTLPGGKSQFTETAGGDELRIWQPPEFPFACTIMPNYSLVEHISADGATSAGDDGYMLFSGRFGASGYSSSRLAPYGEAWYAPDDWNFFGSSGDFDPGTNCYKCLSTFQVTTVDGWQGAWCSQTFWPIYTCNCSTCGSATGDAFLKFPEGFDCNDPDFCGEFELPGTCKTGLSIEWLADVPFNGVVIPDENQPLHAKVMVLVPYPPTCFSNAENTAGVKAHVCTTAACCLDGYGGVKGVCYPEL